MDFEILFYATGIIVVI